MKKCIIAFLLGWLFCGALSAQNADIDAANLKKAQQLLEWVQTAKGDSVWAECAQSVQDAVTPKVFDLTWTALETQCGEYVSHGEWQTTIVNGMPFYHCDLTFKNYVLRFNVAFDDMGKCIVINMIPVPEEPLS